MTVYRSTMGYRIKKVSSDPANTKEGQIWYNSSTKQLKISPLISAWASGGNMNAVGRGGSLAQVGTQNAQVAAGGNIPSPSVTVEEYDGSSWTNVTAVPEKLAGSGGAGTQTAGLFFGGFIPASDAGGGAPASQSESFHYDGTNWTAGGDLGTSRTNLGCIGTQTAALGCGGYTIAPDNDPGQIGALSEEYNGSAWSEGNNLNTARLEGASFGSQTAGVFSGGRAAPGTLNVTEEYNGTSWTNVENFPETRSRCNGSGVLTAGIVFAGQGTAGSVPTNKSTTFTYDGTNYAADAALGTARYQAMTGGGSTVPNSLCVGGHTNTTVSSTEEYGSSVTTRTIDVS